MKKHGLLKIYINKEQILINNILKLCKEHSMNFSYNGTHHIYCIFLSNISVLIMTIPLFLSLVALFLNLSKKKRIIREN